MLKFRDISKLSSVRTPFYYYDMDRLETVLNTVQDLAAQYGIMVHYAIKANAEERILERMTAHGFGADCVSGGEVKLAARMGFPAEKILFAGVGKTDEEIEIALENDIAAFNVESLEELEVIDAIAGKMGKKARIALRVNPNIDAHTHHYVTTGLQDNKFGVSDYLFEDAVKCIKSLQNIEFVGLHFHIGSQITAVDEIYALECERAGKVVDWFEEQGLHVRNVDLGGGLGVNYEHPDSEAVPEFEKWFQTIHTFFKRAHGRTVRVEPGRALVAQCGSLISRVLYVKRTRTKEFAILDAGMNDLIRPALYGAYHRVENVTAGSREEYEVKAYDIVGPVCESSDTWGEGRVLPESFRGDIMAIRSAGAYGSVMASNYNQRPFAPAVFSDEL